MFKEIPLESRKEKRGARRTLTYNRGINDAPYQTTIKINGVRYTCPYFSRWKTMFDRCYNKTWLRKHPTYLNCTVSPEWYSFMSFKVWMTTQDWQDKQLDKDILSLGTKVYSPNTCLFVSRQINSLFNERENAQGELPLGIYGRNNRYEVGVSYGDGKRSWVGVFNTIPEAIDAYVSAKQKAVHIALQKEPNRTIRAAVEKYLQHFTDKMNVLKAAY